MQTESDLAAALADPDFENTRELADPLPEPIDDLSWLDDVFRSSNNVAPTQLSAGKLLEVSKIANTLNVHCDRLREEREGILLQRDQAIYEWKSINYKIAFVRESSDGLSRQLEAFANQRSSEAHAEDVRKLRSQWLSDYQTFEAHVGKLQELQAELGRIEKRMQCREDVVKKTSQLLLRSIEELGLHVTSGYVTPVASEHTSTEPGTVHSEAPPQIHPTIASYYDRIADLKIMYERVSQIFSDFEEEKATLAFQEDQGVKLDHATDELEERFRLDHEHGVCEYRAARNAVREAFSACESEGLISFVDKDLVEDDIRNYNLTPRGAEVVASGHPSDLVLGPPEQSPPSFSENDRVVSSSHLTMFTRALHSNTRGLAKFRTSWQYNQEAIQKWMEGIETMENLEMSRAQQDLAGIATFPDPAPLAESILPDDDYDIIERPQPSSPVPQHDHPRKPLPVTPRVRSSSDSKRYELHAPTGLNEALVQWRNYLPDRELSSQEPIP